MARDTTFAAARGGRGVDFDVYARNWSWCWGCWVVVMVWFLFLLSLLDLVDGANGRWWEKVLRQIWWGNYGVPCWYLLMSDYWCLRR